MASRPGSAERDVTAIMQFVLVTLVILPVLPDRAYDPYGVLNPFQVWLMVVLIVGIGLAGYVAYKLFGARAGTVLGGLLGGLISSTATTLSYARRTSGRAFERRTRGARDHDRCGTVFVRLLVEIAIVAPDRFLPDGAAAGGDARGLRHHLALHVPARARSRRRDAACREIPAELRSCDHLRGPVRCDHLRGGRGQG